MRIERAAALTAMAEAERLKFLRDVPIVMYMSRITI